MGGVKIPDNLCQDRDVDTIAAWVVDQNIVCDNKYVYIGVYNWGDNSDE